MKKLNNSTLKAKKQTRETIISFRSNVFKFCLKIKTFVLILEKDFLFKLQELLLRIDIEKAFDSANHNFLLKVLKNYGFSQDFLKWTNILLQNQELCVIDGGRITYSFPLKRGTPF